MAKVTPEPLLGTLAGRILSTIPLRPLVIRNLMNILEASKFPIDHHTQEDPH